MEPRKVFSPPLTHTGSSRPSRICQPMHIRNNPCNWQWPYGTWLYLSLLQPCYLWPSPPEKQGALFLQPNTSAHPCAGSRCEPHLFYSLLVVQRSNWCALPKDFHTAQNILSKNRLCSRHTTITPTLTDDSPPWLLFHSSELVTTLSCDQQGKITLPQQKYFFFCATNNQLICVLINSLETKQLCRDHLLITRSLLFIVRQAKWLFLQHQDISSISPLLIVPLFATGPSGNTVSNSFSFP